jgi:MFS family permease
MSSADEKAAPDVEAGVPQPEVGDIQGQDHDLEAGRAASTIDFDEGDAADPLQWPRWKKVSILLNVSLLAAVGQMASSMIAPAVPQIITEFRSTNGELAVFVVSVFLLGQAFGLLTISGLSEVYGRVPVFTACNVLFVAFAVATAVASSMDQLIGFRFLLGIASSAPPGIGGGVIGDMFPPEERGRATALYAFGMMIGPLIGPIAGGYLSGSQGWRWVCWLITILVCRSSCGVI